MKITVNGTEYASWQDVPEHLRDLLISTGALPDTDHDGMPDVGTVQPSHTVTRVVSSVEVDGVTYDSVEQVPQPMRGRLEAAGLLDPNTLGPEPRVLPPAPAPQGQVLLNGVPIDAATKPKRWWRRDR